MKIFRVKCINRPSRDGKIDNNVKKNNFYNVYHVSKDMNEVVYFTFIGELGEETTLPEYNFRVMGRRRK